MVRTIMPEYTYELKLNSEQAMLVINALDFWARCNAGQLQELSTVLKDKDSDSHYIEIDYHIHKLKNLLFPKMGTHECKFDKPKVKEALNITRALESTYYNTEHPLKSRDPMDGSFISTRYDGPYEDWWIGKPAEVTAWASASGEESGELTSNECKEIPEEHEWKFNVHRREWICEHGVGHYDPTLVKNTVHGCDGCCSREDFPGNQDNFII